MSPAEFHDRGFGLPRTVWQPLVGVLAASITIVAAAWSLNVPRMLGVSYYPQQYLAIALALALAIVFLSLAPDRSRREGRVAWYDGLAALLGFGTGIYVALVLPTVANQIFFMPPEAYVPGVILTALTLEALRRSTGWALVVIILLFLVYAMFGDVMPGRLAARVSDWRQLAGYMAFDSNGILGIAMSVAATVVIAFIFFGSLLNYSGGSRFFTDSALLSMGRFRGGSMKIAVAASGLFGSISGSAVANVVATGVVTIPMIKRDRYPAHKAAAIEAVASTGGQLMPPVMGAAAFLMAEFLQVPYSDVALAALVPALLYYGALFIQADLEAARLGISGAPDSALPKAKTVLGGLHFVVAFALLIYALFAMRWQPERAALLAAASVAVTAFIFGYEGKRLSLRQVVKSIVAAGENVVEIIVISAGAGVVIGVLNLSGLSFNLGYLLVQAGGGSAILLLVLAALICIVLGMGLPTLGVYVLLASLVAPALVEVGIQPMAAHLFVLYYGMMSMITPPIALAAFAAAALAKAPAMQTGFAAMRFGWSAYVVPFLFVFQPALILRGDPWQIALAIATAAVGVWLVSAALAGYLATRLSTAMRIMSAVLGLMCLVPAGAFPGAVYTDIVGVIGGVALLAIERFRSVRRHQPSVP